MPPALQAVSARIITSLSPVRVLPGLLRFSPRFIEIEFALSLKKLGY